MLGGKIDITKEAVPPAGSAESHLDVLGQRSLSGDFLNTGDSIIGSDLVISAQDLIIISRTSLQLHGKTRGEVRATDIVIGKSAQITGTITAETIVIHGEVLGTIRAPSVSLSGTACVEGEIHHHSLEITHGAIFHGQSYYDAESANLMPKLNAA